MGMRCFGSFILLCAAVCLSACTLLPEQQQEKENSDKEPKMVVPPPLHLGAVHQVYPEQGFALLRMIGPVPAPGTTLISHPADGSNDRVGNLCVSNATSSRNGIIAADIRSGTVVKGDRIFLYREIAVPEGQEQEDDAQPDDANITADDTIVAEDDTPVTPQPAPEPEPQQVDTTVLPEDNTPAPAPSVNTPDGIPDSIRDIPDSINDWDNM